MPVQFSLSLVQSAPSAYKSLHATDFTATDISATLCTLGTCMRYGMLRVPSCDCGKYCTIDVKYFDVLICTTHDDGKCPLLMIGNGCFSPQIDHKSSQNCISYLLAHSYAFYHVCFQPYFTVCVKVISFSMVIVSWCYITRCIPFFCSNLSHLFQTPNPLKSSVPSLAV